MLELSLIFAKVLGPLDRICWKSSNAGSTCRKKSSLVNQPKTLPDVELTSMYRMKYLYTSIYLSIDFCLSIYVSIYMSIYLSFYLSFYLSIYLSIYESIYPSIHPSIYYIMGYNKGYNRDISASNKGDVLWEDHLISGDFVLDFPC